jgi:hypothetical protein
MPDVTGVVLEQLRAKDAQLFSLSDAFDVKASIALVVITFLATQSAAFLEKGSLLGRFEWVQRGSAVALAAAGALAVVALWPRVHQTETAEGLRAWAQQLREYYKDQPNPEMAVTEAFHAGLVERLEERIAVNSRIDQSKSRYVDWSFKCTAAALALNMATLLAFALA